MGRFSGPRGRIGERELSVLPKIYVSNVQFFIVDLKKIGASASTMSVVILGREKKKVTLELKNWKENEIKTIMRKTVVDMPFFFF